MLTIEPDDIEYFDESTNAFHYEEQGILQFEYSLKALFEWEAKYKKPFLKGNLTDEETLDFYMMMSINPISVDEMTQKVVDEISDYIKNTPTATVFNIYQDGSSNKVINRGKTYTAEEIYALMFSAGIPIEFESRNLNRLLIILRIISTYNEPPKKMDRQDVLKQNATLNAQRKAQMKTKG